jgi:hypothetical protein
MKKWVLTVLMLATLPAFGQNTRFDFQATTTTGAGNLVPVLAIPGAHISFYTNCTSLPCSIPAVTFLSATGGTTCPSNAQVVWQLPIAIGCVSTADAQGNFGGYFAAGTYQFTETVSGKTFGPYQFNAGGGGSSALPIWIDVRTLGAKCDGATDDHAAIQTALNTPGYNNVLIPAGFTCLSSTGLTIPGNNGTTNATNSLEVDGVLQLSATISTPFISLGTATSWLAPQAGFSRSVNISGIGVIDANYLAPIAIDVVNASGVYVTTSSVQNATLFGVLGGDSTVTCTAAHCFHSQIYLGGNTTIQLANPTQAGTGSWGNCTTSLAPPGFAALTNAAAAICMDQATDNVIDSTVLAIGYPVGASIHSGDNRISFHPWAATFGPTVGRMQIGVDDYAQGTQITNCYIDTPQIFGIWEHSFNAVIDNCFFFQLNGAAPDNTATGVYFSQTGPFASVTNSRFEGGASSRFANDVVVSGGSLSSMSFTGNSTVSNVVTSNAKPSLNSLKLFSALQFVSSANTVSWTDGPDTSSDYRVHDVTGNIDHLVLFPNGSNNYNVPSGQSHAFNINGSPVLTLSNGLYEFSNNQDSPSVYHFDSGNTTAQQINWDFVDRGTTFWDVQKDVNNGFRIHDEVANLDRLVFFSNAFTFFEVPAGQGFEFIGGTGILREITGNGIDLEPVGTAIASATTITPINPITHVTGTTPINTITIISGCSTVPLGCQITLIPDGLWSTTTSGNIALATTAVANKALIMTYDSNTNKWYPSY